MTTGPGRRRVERAIVLAAFWIPLGICAWVACTPNPPAGLLASLSGMVAHAAAFTYLAVALACAHFPRGSLLHMATWLFAFGVLVEVAQLFVDGRSGQFIDLAYDASGIALGAAAYTMWMSRPGRGDFV